MSLGSSHYTNLNNTTFYVFLKVFKVEGSAIFHEESSYDMRTMQPDFDIILVVERHISEDSNDGAHHVGIAAVSIDHEHIKKDVNQV